jgi:hypothetical protein
MTKKLKTPFILGWLCASLFTTVTPALANDHQYPDDNGYFSSKYHHRHSQHWNNKKITIDEDSSHWGRHHHHGIQLDGNDGRA